MVRPVGWNPVRFLCALVVALYVANLVDAQHGLRPGQVIELQQQLETGLRARLPSEFDYIEAVIAKVNVGELPQALVRSTFVYARKKRPYPLQYFDRALRIRARRQGILGVPILRVDIR